MTLIELLVVVVIITTLVAAAIPLIAPSNDDRRLREAARGLNTFISGAQTRAIALRRPFGVAIKRLSQDTKKNTVGDSTNDNGMSVEAFYVEQLPPYAGFDANSRACVAIHPNQAGRVLIRLITRGPTLTGLPTGWTNDAFPDATLRPGDVIEINGTQYMLLADTDGFTNIEFRQPDAAPISRSTKRIGRRSSWPDRSTTAASRSIRNTITRAQR